MSVPTKSPYVVSTGCMHALRTSSASYGSAKTVGYTQSYSKAGRALNLYSTFAHGLPIPITMSAVV